MMPRGRFTDKSLLWLHYLTCVRLTVAAASLLWVTGGIRAGDKVEVLSYWWLGLVSGAALKKYEKKTD